jgi:GntR family transcriptional regulator
MGRFYSLAHVIEAQGIAERSELIAREFSANEKAANKLGVAATTPLLHFKRLRFAGSEPLAIDDSWLLANAGKFVVERQFEQGSLYAFLSDAGGPRVTGARERVRAAIPDAATRASLQLSRDVAVLVIERLAYAGERAFEWRTSVVRGDRFAFVAEWAAAGSPQA